MVFLTVRSTAASYRLYPNGVELKATTAYSPPTMTNGKFNVSLRHNGGSDPYFYGDIAEIVLYDRAITTAWALWKWCAALRPKPSRCSEFSA